MCGLVGIISTIPITQQLQRAFSWMLLFDEVRGQHSTGVLAVTDWDKDNTATHLKKSVGGQSNYFKEHGVGVKNDKVHLGNINILMGHNRWATQGAVNAENAHPFEFDHVIGAHNGTLPSYQAKSLEGGKDFDVDSQALYNHIDKKGVKDLWENTNGAMALTWYNKTEKSFNIARNNDRPLHFIILDDGKTMVYASEPWMMYIALSRADVKHGESSSITIGKHFCVTIRDGKLHSKEEVLPTYKVRPFQSQDYYQGYYNNSWRGGVYTPANQGGAKEATKVVEVGKGAKVDRLLVTDMTKVSNKEDEVSEAFGILSNGEIVRIHVAMQDRKRAYTTLRIAGMKGGYFTSGEIRETVYSRGSRYKFVSFASLVYHDLGPKESLSRIYEGKELMGFTYNIEPPKILSHHSVEILTQDAWESMAEFGCDCCATVPTFDKQDTLVWVSPHNFICEECKNTPFVQQSLKA